MARHLSSGLLRAALATLAIAVAAVPATAQQSAVPQAGAPDQPPPAVAPSAVPEAGVGQDYARDIVMGEASAPVTFIEYGSFTCPHCAAFSRDVFPQLKTDYIDTGKVKFIHREVYFDRIALRAGMIARCDSGLRYQGFVKELYAKERDWNNTNSEDVIAENLRRIGRVGGLSEDRLLSCAPAQLDGSEMAMKLFANYVEQAKADGIDRTPTFVINGEKRYNMPYAELKAVLDKALGR